MASYRVVRHLASGGFGSVSQVEELNSDGQVIRKGLAMKQLRRESVNDPEDVARFRREVNLMRSLEHEHVIEVIDADLDAAEPYFVMPFARSNLQRQMSAPRAPARVKEEWARECFAAVARGVAHAHEHDVIHRDLKPENVLVVEKALKVADFGLGKDLSSESLALTASRAEIGTPLYRAPEQVITGRDAGKPADVWALGKILAEMLTKARPTLGAPDFSAVPHAYRDYVATCCAESASDRFVDAYDALANLPRPSWEQ
jgi:serine/threonine protein kinase